jgi:arylsulfatase A-like enzyme/Tfp pilus assembly protein PilF
MPAGARGRNKKGPAQSSPAAASPRRRRVLAVVAGAVLVAALAAVYLWPRASQADLRRIEGQNILLVTIDTLRADALGSYGGPAATPALDRLAAGGVRFDFAHAHAVMTLPAHASILTGRYPFEHGLRDNSGFRLSRDARTAATMLQKAGYATAAFLGAFPLHSRFGLNVGFDVYDDRFGEGSGIEAFTMPERPASAVVALAREWIAGHSKPWFVWVHVFDPHAPYRPPPPFDTRYASQPYYGEVAATDAALAPLLDDVRNSARPTLVIATGDHGEGLGDHGEEAHGIFAYESTLRIPLIVAQLGGAASPAAPASPGGRAATGEVSPVAARHVDILPTILDAVGQPTPPDLPGRTLLPGKERRAGSPPRAAYFEAMSGMLNHGWAPLTGVLSGRDKFIDLPLPERYDLAADSAERSNLAGRSPERDRVLEAALAAFRPALPGQRVAEDAEASRRLRALGYVSGDAPRKARYTEDDDPKRLVELDSAVHRALDAFGEGRRDEAAKIYRQVIERRPTMAIAYRHLAFIEWQQGNAAGALDVLRQAVAHGVTDARLLEQLGEYLTETGRVGEGIGLLEQAAGSPSAEVDALNALGIAYARAGRAADARRAFERLLDVLPGSSTPLESLGMLALDQGDARAAKDYFDRAVAAAPGSSRAHAGVGTAAFAGGDRRTAYEAWRRAVELDPANFEALLGLGLNLARDGRMAEARPYLERFLRTAPPAAYADALKEVSRLLPAGR